MVTYQAKSKTFCTSLVCSRDKLLLFFCSLLTFISMTCQCSYECLYECCFFNFIILIVFSMLFTVKI